VAIDFIKIPSPIAMITIIVVIYNRRNPDSIKAKILDVIKVILNTFEITSTIMM
jgi:hypothetical protein